MTKKHNIFMYLLTLSLIATAFMITGDLREAKMQAAIIFSIALIMVEIYFNGIKPTKNKWLLLLAIYMPISVFISPNQPANFMGMQMNNIWSWQPLFKVILFILLFYTIAGHKFSKKEVSSIVNTIVWCGFLTSIYIIFQFFYIDEIFKVSDEGSWGRVAGFIANPTLTSVFTAMIVPLALYRKNYIKTLICAIGSILPSSQIAWAALLFGIIIYFALKGSTWFIVGMSLCIIFLAFSLAYVLIASQIQFHDVFDDHERVKNWIQILKDCKSPITPTTELTVPFTGRGLGAFKFIYHYQHPTLGDGPNRFQQAHNDYLEFLYSSGLIGLSLMLMSIVKMIRDNFSLTHILKFGETGYKRALFASFAIVAFASFGTFTWQIGTTAFYTVIICALIYNKNKLEDSPCLN